MDTTPSFCLNCKAQLNADAKYCDITCRVAFSRQAYNKFNKDYKPTLSYTELGENEE